MVWGFFPIFWKAITGVPAVNVLAHRIVWSFVSLLIWVLLTNRQIFISYIKQPKLLLRLGLAGFLISINWGIYIYAVATNHIVEAGLGYYINPLVNVFGLCIFERTAGSYAENSRCAGSYRSNVFYNQLW